MIQAKTSFQNQTVVKKMVINISVSQTHQIGYRIGSMSALIRFIPAKLLSKPFHSVRTVSSVKIGFHILPRFPEAFPTLRTSTCTVQKNLVLNAILHSICRSATSHRSNSTYVLLFISCLLENLSAFNFFYSLVSITTRSVL